MEGAPNNDDGLMNVRPSHQSLVQEIEWSDDIAEFNEEGHRQYFDSFWLTPQIGLEQGIFTDVREKIGTSIEERVQDEFPSVQYVGAFPIYRSLFYCVNTIKEIKEEKTITIDFPLYGIFVSYQTECSLEEVSDDMENVRELIEEYVKEVDEAMEIIWGYPPELVQHPNMIYLCREDRVLYAEDEFPGQHAPHSIYIDYWDLVTSSPETRDPDEELNFVGHHQSDGNRTEMERTVNLRDVEFRFEVFKVYNTPVKYGGFTIPLSELKINVRNPLSIRLMEEVHPP